MIILALRITFLPIKRKSLNLSNPFKLATESSLSYQEDNGK